MNKLFLVLGVLLAAFLAGCISQQTGSGRVVFAITDAASDMSGVTSVNVTVNQIKLHSEEKGWITVSSTPKTYDLLVLKSQGSASLLADVQVPNGTYNLVTLEISRVVVTDASGAHDAKLPSNELKLKGEVIVRNGTTTTATFDFIADKSLHKTGNGLYILTPVVKMESREEAEVEIDDNERVQINGGRMHTNKMFGMDVEGNFEEGIRVDENARLFVEDNGKIRMS
jgi:hypothetical protein